MSSSKTQVNIGDRLTGKVSRITPNKVFVEFPTGDRGFIRQRELSWKETRPDPNKLVKAGDEIETVILSIDHEKNSFELSLRFVERDPWVAFLEEYKVGDIVEGIVEGVRPYGAFVEIIDGVTGFLPVSEISQGKVDSAQDVLWLGDKIRAVIKEIEVDKRRFRISIRDYLVSLPYSISENEDTSLRDHLDASTLRKMKQLMGDIAEEVIWPEPDRIQNVLIIDDHNEFREEMGKLLQEWGYTIFEAEDIRTGREQLEKQPVDLVFLDLSLSDGSTIDFATEIIRDAPYTHILMLSGIDTDEVLIEQVQKNNLLLEYKPFGAEPLAEYLISLEKNGRPHTSVQSSSSNIHQNANNQTRLEGYFDRDIEQVLQALVDKSEIKGAIIFQEIPGRKREIEWQYPINISIEDEEAHALLYFSPVGDVIRDRLDLIIDNRFDNPGQSKYLAEFVPFVSCAGFVLKSPSLENTAALFLFSDDANAFSPQSLSDTDRLGLESYLFRQTIFRGLLTTQNEVLRSQLRAGALHDVNNSLGSVDFKLSRLAERLRELEDEYLPNTVAQASLLVNEIQATATQMRKTIEVFRKLGRSNTSEKMDINSIVRRSVERQKPLANHLNVDLTFAPEHSLPTFKINPLYLQQAVDNIILNAIQWSAGRRPHRVEITTSSEQGINEKHISIRVLDTGPGIHAQLQRDRIYELGYTQRKNGSGLGLFIAKALIGAMHGQIKIEQSIMEIGTTFRIDLPY